jgi:DNA repair protein RadA/Sms
MFRSNGMPMSGKSSDKTIFVCSACGKSFSRWMGKCADCGEWNTIIEEKVAVSKPKGRGTTLLDTGATPIGRCNSRQQPVIRCGLEEFDQLLGGGIVPDSSILIGGEPGIGKSTLMLQVAGGLAQQGLSALYCTGEESTQQVGMRGARVGITTDYLQIAAVRELPQIYAMIDRIKPSVVIIDSVQTLYDPDLESAPGTVSQIRSTAAELVDFCKRGEMLLVLIGHITKDGAIAGPKILEHLVDVVLYFEGESHNWFRLLRVKKNRFGPASEIGIFQIGEEGLFAVGNPSELFLNEYPEDIPGRAVVTAVEGQRPLLLEIQALATQTNFGFPQRVSSGYDSRRLALMLAILEKRQRIPFGQRDVFVNLAGGLKIDDPALDLGLMASLISSVEDIPVQPQTVIIGEVGLSGEVRAVPYTDRRIAEAAKLGFQRIILPRKNLRGLKPQKDLTLIGIEKLQELPKAVLM